MLKNGIIKIFRFTVEFFCFKWVTASILKKTFSTWETRYTSACMHKNISWEVKKYIRATTAFKCILLSFCVIFIMHVHEDVLRQHGKQQQQCTVITLKTI